MLKNFLLLSAAILFGIAPSSGPTFAEGRMPQDTPAPAATNPVKPTAASLEKAKKLYKIDCAMCHGENGNGKTDLGKDMQLTLPDWTNPASLAGKLDQSLFNAIRNGKGSMPSEAEGRASDAEVWNLIHYIRGMSKGRATEPIIPDNQSAAPAKSNN
jgi:mono/diheme cytochrome c family protein